MGGASPNGSALSPLEDDRLAAFFGPHRLDIPRHGLVRRRVLYTTQQVTATGPVDTATILAARTTGVICNVPRNRLVVALAADLVGRHGGSTPNRFGVVAKARTVPGDVVVLAANGKHKQRLQNLVRLTGQQTVRVVTSGVLQSVFAGAAGSTGILVRADAGCGLPSPYTNLWVEPQTVRSPLLVLDVSVPHLAWARTDRKRETAYCTAEWVPLDADRSGYADWSRWVWRRQS